LLHFGRGRAQAIDFQSFVLHIRLQMAQLRGAPSRFGLFYNGPVNFGRTTGTLQETPPAHFSFHIAVSAFRQQPR
jgi:hypothetical protein